MQEILDQVTYYLDALWRRRWIALGGAFLVACLGWTAVATLPDRYEASSRIYVDTASVLNPLLKGVAVDTNTAQHLQVMRQTLLARPNLEEVARRTDMDLQAKTAREFEAIIDGLEDRVALGMTDAKIFSLTYRDEKPERARQVVQELTTLFVQNNLGENRKDMESAQRFLQRQVDQYESKLDEAESRLAQFKQENRQLLPGQSGLQEKLAEAEDRLAELRGDLEAARTRRDILQRELDQTPKMLAQGQRGFGAGPPSRAEAEYMEVRTRLENLKSRYTDQHPDVRAAQRRLDALKEEMTGTEEMTGGPGPVTGNGAANGTANGAESPEGADGPEGAGEAARPAVDQGIQVPNPTYSELRVAMVDRDSEIETLRQALTRQQQKVADTKQKLERVPEVEARLQKLRRDYNVMQSRYEALLSRRETAEISADRENQSDRVEFRIVEPPRVPTTPAGPPRAMYLAAVLVFGLGSGVGGAGLLALTKVTYGSVRHLHRDFDLRVIGLVTEVPSARQRVWKIVEGMGLALALAVFLGIFAALLLIESQVGLPNVLEAPATAATVQDVLTGALRGMTGGF